MRASSLVARAGRLFQSAPGREAGRCALRVFDQTAGERFNPRPAVRPGDAPVSVEDTSTPSMFQSAPGREAGRCAQKPLV